MTEIETTWGWAINKRTGARFSLNPVPFEFAADQCIYENPQSQRRVLFEARFINEKIKIPKNSVMIDDEVCRGLILIDDQLRQRIKTFDSRSPAESEIEALIQDCYDLIIEYISANEERRINVRTQPHIYVASLREFEMLSTSVEVDPTAIAASRAVQVR